MLYKLLRNTFCILLLLAFITVSAGAYADISTGQSLNITSKGAIIVDLNTDTILYKRYIHDTCRPASLTKMMTLLVAYENTIGRHDELVSLTAEMIEVPKESSSAYLSPKDKITIRDLFYAMMLPSGNDAAKALAYIVSGNEANFAVLMNAKAKELGMTNSSFKNAHGFDVEGHYTTPYDLALLCEALCENEALVNIFSQFKYTVTIYPNGNLDAPASQTYYNTNLMLNPNSYLYYPGYKGIKTGYTSLAGNCLAGYYEADGRRFIAITMNSDQSKRDEDMKKLLDYALKNFDTLNLREVFSSKQIIVDLENASLTDESNGQLELHLIHPDETKYITVPKSEGTKIRTFDEKTIMIRYPVLKAPQKTGDTVGTVEYIYNNEVIYSCTAVASRSVDAEIDSPMDLVSLGIKGKSRLSFAFLTSKYFLIPTSIIVALLLLIGGFLFLRRRQVMRIRSRQRNGIARRKRRRSSSLYR